ncbi:hypothetical protein AHAS_Ahas08G0099800 [Arachis hypogaea]
MIEDATEFELALLEHFLFIADFSDSQGVKESLQEGSLDSSTSVERDGKDDPKFSRSSKESDFNDAVESQLTVESRDGSQNQHTKILQGLIRKHPNVYLIVAGSGPWTNRYKDLGRQVLVLGSMDPSMLRAFYNAIDIFVNPTLRPQGLDLTLMEAMMSEKPLLASRFPRIKGTIVVDDEFGFMFSPNVESLLEAVEAVVNEGKETLARRGKACREYANSMFTARKMALAYERLFLCIKKDTFCSYP